LNLLLHYWSKWCKIELSDWKSSPWIHYHDSQLIFQWKDLLSIQKIPSSIFILAFVVTHSLFQVIDSQNVSFYMIFYANLNHTELARSASALLSTVLSHIAFYVEFLHHHDTSLQDSYDTRKAFSFPPGIYSVSRIITLCIVQKDCHFCSKIHREKSFFAYMIGGTSCQHVICPSNEYNDGHLYLWQRLFCYFTTSNINVSLFFSCLTLAPTESKSLQFAGKIEMVFTQSLLAPWV
jgi:hypothetical protein